MNWSEVPWATITTVIAGLIIIVVGAIVTISGDMSFEKYVETIAGLSIGAGLLGVGRGIRRNGQPTVAATKAKPTSTVR